MTNMIDRHEYIPSGNSHWVGLVCTGLIYAVALAGLMLTVSASFVKLAPRPALRIFDLKAAASPPETPPKEVEAPKPVEKQEKLPEPPKVEPIEQTDTPFAQTSMLTPVPTPKPADPHPRQPEAAAPRSMPAPPAPQASSNAPDTWEGRLLAHLNKSRRYPISAQTRRQQGVPYVRFVIDREGKVLSSRLERSSGVNALDREAVALPKRAQPLPKPPADKPGDTIELVVPVEFFLRGR